MQDLSRLRHQFDKSKRECQAIIETPRGRRNKFKYEADSNLFTLSRVLPQGFTFPFEFGFIPGTEGQDGDPLDVVVLMDEPAHVGCILKVKLIGVIRLLQTEKGKEQRNDRLIGVSVQSYDYEGVESSSDLKASFLKQITDFLALYNKDSEKQDKIESVEGPEQAVMALEKAIQEFERKSGSNK